MKNLAKLFHQHCCLGICSVWPNCLGDRELTLALSCKHMPEIAAQWQSHKQLSIPEGTSPSGLVINKPPSLLTPSLYVSLNKTSMMLTQTPLLWLESSILALTWEFQSTSQENSKESMCPRCWLSVCLYLAVTTLCGPVRPLPLGLIISISISIFLAVCYWTMGHHPAICAPLNRC